MDIKIDRTQEIENLIVEYRLTDYSLNGYDIEFKDDKFLWWFKRFLIYINFTAKQGEVGALVGSFGI